MTFFLRAAVTIGFLIVLFGQQQAFAFCVLGIGDTIECRYIEACTKRGASRANCICSFKLGQEAFPPDQLGTLVEVFEAYADNDRERVKLIKSRLGFQVIDFKARLYSVADEASAKCGR